MTNDEGGVKGGSRDLQDHGRKLLAALYSALRALKFYPLENEVVQQALDELHQVVSTIIKGEGFAELRMVGDFFFLNEERLRLDLRNFSTFGAFARALRDHELGELVIDRGVQRDEWAPFLSLLLGTPDDQAPFDAFVQGMSNTSVLRIEVRPEREAESLDLGSEAMDGARQTYAHSVRMARDVLSDIRIGRHADSLWTMRLDNQGPRSCLPPRAAITAFVSGWTSAPVGLR